MDNQNKYNISVLLLRLIEDNLSDKEIDYLKEWLDSGPDAKAEYLEFIEDYTVIKTRVESEPAIEPSGEILLEDDLACGMSSIQMDSNTSLRGVGLDLFNLEDDSDESEDSGLTQAMLEIFELERTSPAVEIPKEEPKRQLIQKVESDFQWFPGRPSKRKIRTLLAIAASILVTIGYLNFFAPNNVDRPVVAKLSDSIDAAWDNELQMPDEYGYMVQSRYRLEKGFADILFNDGASVTVEAPAEMSLNSGGDMELFTGRIYATVPQKAQGFAVKAKASKIVDLGTEFGVEIDNAGNTQLHVAKGRTLLFAGLLSDNKQQISLDAGSAKKVYNDGFVKDIPADKKKFARRINSRSNLILRDQKLNLADVIGGGNGFGTGTLEKGIDMLASRFQMFKGENLKRIDTQDFTYKLFSGHPYIDGVCIPNGGAGPVKISSKGHIFENCPISEGKIWSGVFNGAFHSSKNQGIPKTQSSLGGIVYGTVSNPAIYMTPNQAVTFDLDAIRGDMKGVSIAGFTAKAGLSETLLGYSGQNRPKTSFYILVDGVVRFSKIDQQVNDKELDIRVDIGPNDRFLTIMTLQGTDGRTDFECSLFAEPSLHLE